MTDSAMNAQTGARFIWDKSGAPGASWPVCNLSLGWDILDEKQVAIRGPQNGQRPRQKPRQLVVIQPGYLVAAPGVAPRLPHFVGRTAG
jgi:hypothetical protein